jgi:hypothetical protein
MARAESLALLDVTQRLIDQTRSRKGDTSNCRNLIGTERPSRLDTERDYENRTYPLFTAAIYDTYK